MFSRTLRIAVSALCAALCSSAMLMAEIPLNWQPMTWAGSSKFNKLADGTLTIAQNSSQTSGAWGTKNLSVRPGEMYEISAEIASALTGGSADLTVDFLNRKNKRIIAQRLISVKGKKDFKKFAARFTVPAETSVMLVYAIAQRASGEVKFRNINLKKTASAKTSGITLKWHQMNWAGSSKFSTLTDGTLLITRNDSKTSGAWGSNTIAVKPGDTFAITAEMSTELEGGSGELAVDFLDKNNKRVISKRLILLTGKKVFRKVSAQFIIPAGTEKMMFYAIGQHACGTVKFRNFTLTKVKLSKLVFKQNNITWRPATDESMNKYHINNDEFIIERQNDAETSGMWLSDPIKVTPRDYYNISCEISGSNMTALSSVNVIFYGKDNRQIARKKTISRIAEQKNFLAENKNIFVPNKAATMRLTALMEPGKGTARYRNIKITKLPTELIFSEYAHVRNDLSTRIGWRSTVPEYQQATVTFKTYGMPDVVIREKESGLINHSVILPAGTFPTGKIITAVISYTKNKAVVSKAVYFTAGAVKRLTESKDFSIKLSIAEPTDKARKVWPVTGGIPFAKGTLRDSIDVMLTDDKNTPLPAEFYVISRWDDGSVQFLGYTFETATSKAKTVTRFLTNRTVQTDNFKKATSKLRKVIDSISGKIVTADGKIFTAKPAAEKFVIHTSPACETAEIKGSFSGDSVFGYRLFVRGYPSGITTVQYNIYGGNDDTLIRNIQWEMPPLNNPELSGRAAEKIFSTLQRDEKNGTGDGFVLDRKANFAVGMQHYREKWPKGIANDNQGLALQVLPPLPADYVKAENLKPMDIMIKYYWLKDGCYIYRRKLELTGTFTVTSANSRAAWCQNPLVAVASPEYYCATGVFENIAPRKSGEFDSYEKLMSAGFDNLKRDRKLLGQYGWMNFGDWFGERHINWGNNEYDLAYVMALAFARTAETAYYFRGLEMADHHQAIDRFVPANTMDRRTKYKHCAGHTGNFFAKEDPRLASVKNQLSYVIPAFDIEGGHNYETGSLLMAGLSGDKELFDRTMLSVEQMAGAFTQEIIFGIERGPGWLLENLVTGLFFTSDPYYRVASEICLDKVFETQSRENGSMNLPQDVRECQCPDKYSHRGGKPFAVGVMMHSLIRFYNLTGNEKAKLCVSDFARWLVDSAWDPRTALFRYKTGCPARSDGSSIYPLLLDSLWTVGKWSGDKRYNEIIIKYAGLNFPHTSSSGKGQGVGKHFCMAYRHIPHLFKQLKDDGITDLQVNLSKEMIATMKFRKPANAITVEAENFKSQNGGAVKIRSDKAGTEKCFSHWDKKEHSVTWKIKNKAGKYKFYIRYCTTSDAARRITVGDKSVNAFISTSGGLGDLPTDWLICPLKDENGKEIILDLPADAEFTLTNISGTGLNLDLFYLIPVKK